MPRHVIGKWESMDYILYSDKDSDDSKGLIGPKLDQDPSSDSKKIQQVVFV